MFRLSTLSSYMVMCENYYEESFTARSENVFFYEERIKEVWFYRRRNRQQKKKKKNTEETQEEQQIDQDEKI